MHIVWHCSLTTDVEKFEAVMAIVYDWCSHHCRGIKYGDLGRFSGVDDTECEIARFLGEDMDVQAFQLSKPIAYQGLVWTTSVGLEKRKGGLRISIEVGQTRIPNLAVRRESIKVRAPRFLEAIMRMVLTQGDLVKLFGATDPSFLIELIDNPQRQLPLVIVSEAPWTSRPVRNPEEILKHVRGLAIVVWLSKDAGLLLANSAERFGLKRESLKAFIPYNGFVKIVKDRRKSKEIKFFEAPLYTPDEIRNPEFLDDLVDWLAFHSTTQDHPRINLQTVKDLIGERERGEAETLYYTEEEKLKKSEADYMQLKRQYDELQGEYLLKMDEYEGKINDLDAKNRALKYRLNEKGQEQQEVGEAGEAVGQVEPTLYFHRGAGGRRPALDFIDELPEVEREQVLKKIYELPSILAAGKSKYFEKLRTKGYDGRTLYEYRVNSKDSWIRFFFSKSEARPEVIVLSGYQKKQNDLDDNEIASAENKLREAITAGWE